MKKIVPSNAIFILMQFEKDNTQERQMMSIHNYIDNIQAVLGL